MKKARNNRGFPSRGLSVDPNLDFSELELEAGSKGYRDWHWGFDGKKVVDWNDSDMPRMLIECGKLVRLHVRVPNSKIHPRRRKDSMIEFSRNVSPHAHVTFDPDHKYQRLYLLVPPEQRATLKKKFWNNNPFQALPLSELAQIAGGQQGNMNDYPDVLAKPLGVLTAVVYVTAKKGDSHQNGGSFYIHHVGEISHTYPFLCIDDKGRLWLTGGSTTAPTPGITD